MNPHVIDLHYGVLNGVGWGQYEDYERLITTTTTQEAGLGALALQVIDARLFKVDQLICFVGENSQYYSAAIKRIVGDVITLKTPLPVRVPAGAPLYNFYANDAHPNVYGYYAVADISVRMLTHCEMHVASYPAVNWAPYAGAAITPDRSFAYNNPGADRVGFSAALVSCADLNQGAISPPVTLPGGVYCISMPVNVGQRVGGYTGNLEILVQEALPSGEVNVISSQAAYGYDGIKLVKAYFSAQAGGSVRVLVRNANAGGAYFSLGQIGYYRVTDKIKSLDHGKHVLFGDSWVARDPFMSRMQERLPNAQVIRRGVPGHSMPNLVARFGEEIAPLKPDYVWVMCGTNDSYAGFTPGRFSAEMNILKRNLMMIGAQPIFWNCSVCSAYYPGFVGEQLTNSRSLAMGVNYHDQMA